MGVCVILSIAFLLSVISLPFALASKIGSPCTKLNSKSWDGNIPVTCQKKSNGKLVWTKFKSPVNTNSTKSPISNASPSSTASISLDSLKVSQIKVLRINGFGIGDLAVEVTNLSKTSSHTHRAFDWILKSSSGKVIDTGYLSDFPWLPPGSSAWILLDYLPLEGENPAVLELTKVATSDEIPVESELPRITAITYASVTKQNEALPTTTVSFRLENLSNTLTMSEGFHYSVSCLDSKSSVLWISKSSQLGKRISPKASSNISFDLYQSSRDCSSLNVNISLRFKKELTPGASPSSCPMQPNTKGEFCIEIVVISGYALTSTNLGVIDKEITKGSCSLGYVYDTVKKKLNYRAKIGDQFRVDASGKTVAIGKLSSFELVSETEVGPAYDSLKGSLCMLKAQIQNIPTENFYAIYFQGVRVGDYSLSDIKKGLVFKQIGLP